MQQYFFIFFNFRGAKLLFPGIRGHLQTFEHRLTSLERPGRKSKRSGDSKELQITLLETNAPHFFLKPNIVYYLLGKDIAMILYYMIGITVKQLSITLYFSSCSSPLEFKKWRKY